MTVSWSVVVFRKHQRWMMCRLWQPHPAAAALKFLAHTARGLANLASLLQGPAPTISMANSSFSINLIVLYM